jgi:hypothetical protein
MTARKRWYAELAGTILLWVQENPLKDPPFTWEGHVIRRPQKAGNETWEFDPDSFWHTSKESAIKDTELTVRQGKPFREYGHRLNELLWRECDLSEEDWDKLIARFIAEGRIEEFLSSALPPQGSTEQAAEEG